MLAELPTQPFLNNVLFSNIILKCRFTENIVGRQNFYKAQIGSSCVVLWCDSLCHMTVDETENCILCALCNAASPFFPVCDLP
jgi:hypothetical protein